MCASAAKAVLSVRKTVLVVDPQRRIHQLLNRLVSEEGWNLAEASNNEAAVSLMKESSYDLVITGQRTSTRQDLDLLQKIRGIRPHVRMIVLTDRKTPQDVIAALRQNVFSFFSTPFNGEYFAHMVRLAMMEPCWDDGIDVIAATPKWIRLSVRCTRDTAARLIQFLRQADLPEVEREEVACASHEIVLNAMEHACNFDPDQYMEVSYLRTKRAIACRVKDPGKGFTLEELREEALDNPFGEFLAHPGVHEPQEVHRGRFGMLLAMKLVDEVICGERGNDVVLIKHLDSPALRPNLADHPSDA
jgi:anti-sigma regulatory factor (Ser/Thr protein kinase)/ActR/RegA family two-component response regulator